LNKIDEIFKYFDIKSMERRGREGLDLYGQERVNGVFMMQELNLYEKEGS